MMDFESELYQELIKEYINIKPIKFPISLKNILIDNNLRKEILNDSDNKLSDDDSDLNLTEIFNNNIKKTKDSNIKIKDSNIEIKDSNPIINNINPVSVESISFNTLNIITPPQLMTQPLIRPILKGGSNNINTNLISIKKINDLLFDKNSKNLRYIMSYYFNNYSQKINDVIIPKILNNNELLLIIASSIYVYFTEKNITDINDIINPTFVNSIPEHFKINFLHLIKDKLKDNQNNFSTEEIQKLIYSMSQKNDVINIEKDDYNIIIYNPSQTGGKRNNIDEKIQNKINKLSLDLKNNQKGGELYIQSIIHDINKYVNRLDKMYKYHTQRGGKIAEKTPEKITDIKNKIDEEDKIKEELKKITTDAIKLKVHNQKMVERANEWAIELINMGVAVKEIEDNEYGIARFVIVASKEEDKSNKEISAVLAFINDTASILRFKNEFAKDELPNIISQPSNIGNAQHSYITDKLTKYYQKKYEELQKLKDTRINLQDETIKKETDIFTQIKEFLGFRGGNPMRMMILESDTNYNIYNTDFLEHCFTSKQYVKFLEKMKSYLKDAGKTIELNELEGLKAEIDQVKKIEDHLLEINKLLVNYKLITDEFPENIKKDITFEHMKNILKSNNALIDEYDNVNLKTLGVVKKIEQFLDIKEELNEQLKDPNVKKEVNLLINKQSGGMSINKNFSKKYMNNNDYEFFTTTKFQTVLGELEKEKDK